MVWNTCMAFFQAALLVGYLYAHLLQKISSLKTQVIVHAVVLIAAVLILPIKEAKDFGSPGDTSPGLWLFGVMAIWIGPAFAALSATAPLAQAWYARVRHGESDASNPYVLYAASNLGSLIALLVYPTLVEPFMPLASQRWLWSGGYIVFVLLMLATAFFASKVAGTSPPLQAPKVAEGEKAEITWKDRLIWIGLAAAPSSLMLGVTTHITTDIASTPFLWVLPLALYLLTFIMAFANRPPIPIFYIFVLHAFFALMMAYGVGVKWKWILLQAGFQVLGFFMTALMCHTQLAERRPHPARLTEFYLLMSFGGVLGGAFNAFVAPAIFNDVWEYPLVLVLACLARPWNWGKMALWEWGLFALSAVCALSVLLGFTYAQQAPEFVRMLVYGNWMTFVMIGAVFVAFFLRDRGLVFAVLVGLILVSAESMEGRENLLKTDRSFFGVLKVTKVPVPGFSNELHVLAHGTTLHGAQATEPHLACEPRVYYAPNTPIGQVFAISRAAKTNLTVGAIGMGTGSVAGFNKAGDVTRFFEIDQDVVDMSTNPKYFSYINGCAQGKVDTVLGDARLKMEPEPRDKYDIILVDAFSSDAVPAHLLTKQAMQMYLTKIKPDGVIIMHLSNRHLDLMGPVAATSKAAGGLALEQRYQPPFDALPYTDAAEHVIIVGRTGEGLKNFAADPRWAPAQENGARVWTDDYTNIFGAMLSSLKGN